MKQSILDIQNVSSLHGYAAVCSDCFAVMGILQFNYSHFPPFGAQDFDRPRMILSSGYPRSWTKAYIDAGFARRDPIVQRMVGTTKPIWLSDVSKQTDLNDTEREYFRLRREFSVIDDLAIPVFGPSGRNGGFGLGLQVNAGEPDSTQINEIQWFCQCAHIRYCELLEGQSGETPSLSQRELEVLRNIARGKTNVQIASELSVTTKTVDTYLARVFHKLEVSDRMTASLRAMALGIID